MVRRTPPLPASEFVTVREVAAELRVSRMTIYRFVEDGTLKSVRVGRSIRISRAAVDAYLEEHAHG